MRFSYVQEEKRGHKFYSSSFSSAFGFNDIFFLLCHVSLSLNRFLQLFLDAPDKLARFSTREDNEDRVYIQDLKRAVSYVRVDDFECQMQNLLQSNDDSSTGGRSTVSFARKLPQILFMSGSDFYYLGKVRKSKKSVQVTFC